MHRIGFNMTYSIQVPQWVTGGFAAAVAYFSPISSLLWCAFIFVAIDFVTGVWASYVRYKRAGLRDKWGFESSKAWNTVFKLLFIMCGIYLAWRIDTDILHFLNLRLANIFTGFVCGVEFWSYLENAAEISQHPIFRALKKVIKEKVDKELGFDTDITQHEKKDGEHK